MLRSGTTAALLPSGITFAGGPVLGLLCPAAGTCGDFFIVTLDGGCKGGPAGVGTEGGNSFALNGVWGRLLLAETGC